jgi:hypothetical protein
LLDNLTRTRFRVTRIYQKHSFGMMASGTGGL